MSVGDRDLKENTRALRELASSQGRILKVLEAINVNLLAVAQQLRKPEDLAALTPLEERVLEAQIRKSDSCTPDCPTCKGQLNGH